MVTQNTVAIVQQPAAVLDFKESLRRASAAVASAAAAGAKLIVFPEAWLTGYPSWVFGLAGWRDTNAQRWHRP
jgi:predicted amidohydrolase